jgi:hypothetical protein
VKQAFHGCPMFQVGATGMEGGERGKVGEGGGFSKTD